MSITAKAYQLVAFSGFNVTPKISDKNLEDWYSTCLAHDVPQDILNGIAVTKLNVPSVNSTDGLSPIGGGYYCPKTEMLFFDKYRQIRGAVTGLLCLPLTHKVPGYLPSPFDIVIASSILSKEITSAFSSGADRFVISGGLLFSCVSLHKSFCLDMSDFDLRGKSVEFPYYLLGKPAVGSIDVDKMGEGVFVNPDLTTSFNGNLGKDIHELFLSSPRNIVFLGGVQSRVVSDCINNKKRLYGRSLVNYCGGLCSGNDILVHDLSKVLASKSSLNAFECAVRDRSQKHIVTTSASFAEEVLTPVLLNLGSSFVKKHATSVLAGFEIPRLCDSCKLTVPIESESVLYMSFSVEDGIACERDPYADCFCVDGYFGKVGVMDKLNFLLGDTRSFIDGYMKSLRETGDGDKYYSLKKDKKIPGVQEEVCRSISEGKVSLQDALRAFK
jgi:hypothetical protein